MRAVPPAALYAEHYDRGAARTPMGLVTWCADHPGLAGRGVLRGLGGTASVTFPGSVARAVARATRAEPGREGPAWAAVTRAVASSAVLVPVTWPAEVTLVSRRLSGPIATAMFPRGDPTALWVGR